MKTCVFSLVPLFLDCPFADSQINNRNFRLNTHSLALHNDIGKYGEELAIELLKSKGYRMAETNWKYSHAEVDIIAWDGEVLVFVEVKTRTTDTFGQPEEFVSEKKMKLLTEAAAVYCEQIDHDWEIRFDVIAVMDRKNQQPTLKHIEDAFFLGLG